MDIAAVLLAALLSPLLGLALLLWLSHLEETLPGAVEAARREPDPAPILAIPVTGEPAPQQPVVAIPAQRPAPVVETAQQAVG